MMDVFERLQSIKENVERLLAEQADVDRKLNLEVGKMEMELALASALSALKAASTDCRHERVRAQIKGARELAARALSA